MPLRKLKNDPLKDGTDSKGSSQASVQKDLERPTAHQVFIQVAREGRQELGRPIHNLAISGLAGGITMGLTALGMSIATAELGTGGVAQLVSHLLYPLGFVAVITGRAQLFTENTLYPVAVVLAERKHLWKTLRLWVIVLVSNCIGAFLFALLAVRTGGLRESYVTAMSNLGTEAANQPLSHIFWSAVIGGWIIALVAWLVSGSHSISGAVLLIYLLTFLVGLGHFAHSVATSGEVLAAVLHHALPASGYFRWLWPAVLGNICGGVIIVTLLEYGQVKEE